MNNQSILLLAAILGLGIFGVVPQDAVAIDSLGDGQVTMADAWLGINSYHLHSSCGGWNLGDALNGEDFWNITTHHSEFPPHWFILDLGEFTAIKKVRGRSMTAYDPASVDIYVSDDLESWGMAVATGITTWQDTSSWVEIDTIDKIGRYIKVEVTAAEGDGGDHYMEWGENDEPEDHITIFDAYAGDEIPAPGAFVLDSIGALNVQSEGKWITWYIWLPEEYDVADIKPDSIMLNGVIEAAWRWIDEEEQVLMAKFSRSEVQDIVEPGKVELTVSGEFTDGTKFEGSVTITVKRPPEGL
ncbi:MAG: discoidin domain-containing protein [Planctomycetota bacterium]